MLHNISWPTFLLSLFFLMAMYWLVILAFFYKRDLMGRLGRRPPS